MAFHVPKAPGFSQMLKDGAKHYSGLEDTVFRNVTACKELAQTTRTAYGPSGMNKLVVNHLGKSFVTNDAATVLQQLEVQHPAARMLVMASQQQEQEVGDGTNYVLLLAGALLAHAEELLRAGLAVPEVIQGYETACRKALEALPECVCSSVRNLHDVKEAAAAIRPAVASKQRGHEDFLSELIAQACVAAYPEGGASFDVDNVRVCKIPGAGLASSSVLRGMVFRRDGAEGAVQKAAGGVRVAAYACALDAATPTETKGTVLLRSAAELRGFSRGEEDLAERHVARIREAGAGVVVCNGRVSDVALHHADRLGLMVVRLHSRHELRRLCRATGATELPSLARPPAPDELGHADSACAAEVGGTQVVVFRNDGGAGAVSTLVLRGSTESLLDDAERAVDDGVNAFKALARDPRLLPGAGAVDIALARRVAAHGEACPGLEQYAVKKFAEALEAAPRALAENAGLPADELVSKLYAAQHHHHDGGGAGVATKGLDVESETLALRDVTEAPAVTEPFLVKHWGIKLACNAAVTVLRVNQIIMAKPAGGPKAPKAKKDWDNDDD